MACVRSDMQLRFRPRPVQVPGALDGTDNIVAALDNHTRYVANLIDVLKEIILCLEETIMHEIMAFNAGEGECESRISKPFDGFGIEEKFRGCALPDAPRARGCDSDLLVSAGQAAIIRTDEVIALILGNDLDVLVPDVRKNPTRAFLIKPLDLFRTAKKNSAQHQLCDSDGMSFGISERQRAAPRAPEYLPLLDAKMLAQLLNVRNQMPRRVVFERSMRRASP